MTCIELQLNAVSTSIRRFLFVRVKYIRLAVRDALGASPRSELLYSTDNMQEAKNTQRALVRIGFDGRVHKLFRGPQADTRFANEVRVLQYLEARKCPFVPRLLDSKPETLGDCHLQLRCSCAAYHRRPRQGVV